MTHECQALCFNTEKFSGKEADNCAKNCMRPFMNARQINLEKMKNCNVIY